MLSLLEVLHWFLSVLHTVLGGNGATSHMLVYALICGVTGACSVLIGAMHFRAWHGDSLASAAASAIISWAVTALAFGYVALHFST